MMNEIKLFLIRHGKTYCNEKQLYSGKTDVDLSAKGIEELKDKAEKRDFPKCDYYFTSGAKRANQTLEILCPGEKYSVLEKLFEYNFGEFELKSYNDLKDIEQYKEWISDESGYVRCPGGESRIEFKERIAQGFNELLLFMSQNNIKSALGVTHGGTIGIILEMMFDDSKKFYEWQPKNGEGYELIIEADENGKSYIREVKKTEDIFK